MLKTRPLGGGTDCFTYTGCQRGDSGYISVNVTFPKGGHRRHVNLHRFIYILYHKIQSFDDLGSGEVSHLCHNKACINIKHLVLESHANNQSRITCRLGDQQCQHIPKCIL